VAGSVRIAALATATPVVEASLDQVWAALGEARGRRMPRLSATEGARVRHLAEPLSSLVATRTQTQQTDAYLLHARALARKVCCDALDRSRIARERIGLVVGVSCTGVVLPSLDAELIPVLGLDRAVARLPITELGCGGGVAGLARGVDYLRAYPDQAVLLFAVELPSLTFQPADHSIDNLIAAMVFGDGAGAMVLESADAASGWMVDHCGTHLIPEAAGRLGFELRDGGLRVVLSRDLPDVVEANLRQAVDSFLDGTGTSRQDLALLALHPGGPRIFEAVARALDVDPGMLAPSRRVFERYGNASSAGIFFVLEELLTTRPDGKVLAIAFGPGLSIEMALMRVTP
jgi:alkylresorcinol/alkylpyrone synthase